MVCDVSLDSTVPLGTSHSLLLQIPILLFHWSLSLSLFNPLSFSLYVLSELLSSQPYVHAATAGAASLGEENNWEKRYVSNYRCARQGYPMLFFSLHIDMVFSASMVHGCRRRSTDRWNTLARLASMEILLLCADVKCVSELGDTSALCSTPRTTVAKSSGKLALML
jgi:hypothetical protein